MKKETRIKITGEGGQGVKFLTNVLGEWLKNRDFFVSYYFLYDAAMRGGKIKSELVFSKSQSQSPIGENFDLLVMLCQTPLNYRKNSKKIIKAENNMLALGMILKTLGFSFDEQSLLKILPERNKTDNLKAIKTGYNLH